MRLPARRGGHSHSEGKCFIHSTCHIAWHVVGTVKNCTKELKKVSTTDKCLVHQRRDFKGIFRNSRRIVYDSTDSECHSSMAPRPAPPLDRPETRHEYGWRAADHPPSLGKQLKGHALAKRRTLHQDQSRLACSNSRQTLASINPQRPNQLYNC